VLVEVYFDAFKRTRLLMNFDVIDMLAYGTQRGAGWRLDCWGDMGRPGKNFAHMLDRSIPREWCKRGRRMSGSGARLHWRLAARRARGKRTQSTTFHT
jgi:hypothetical protein